MTERELIEMLKHYGMTGKFTKKEIEDTGASIESIDKHSFRKLILLRKTLNKPIKLLYNGMTTGRHKSKGHPLGKAYDITTGEEDYYKVFKCAIDAGFKKIGVYWNGSAYSYHLEDAEKCSFWSGTKEKFGLACRLF